MEKGMAMKILEAMEKRYFDSLINLCIAGDLEKTKAHHELRACERDLQNWTKKMLMAS